MTVSLIKRREPQGTIWVCVTCVFARENGVDLRYESLHGMDYDPEDNPSPEPEPWSRLAMQNGGPIDVTMGLLYAEHSCEKNPENEGYDENADAFDCDCEARHFDRSTCDGCGSPLDGERHAYTWWK